MRLMYGTALNSRIEPALIVLLTNHASVPRLPYYIYLEKKVEAPIFRPEFSATTVTERIKIFASRREA